MHADDPVDPEPEPEREKATGWWWLAGRYVVAVLLGVILPFQVFDEPWSNPDLALLIAFTVGLAAIVNPYFSTRADIKVANARDSDRAAERRRLALRRSQELDLALVVGFLCAVGGSLLTDVWHKGTAYDNVGFVLGLGLPLGMLVWRVCKSDELCHTDWREAALVWLTPTIPLAVTLLAVALASLKLTASP